MEHKVIYIFTNKAKAIQWILENNCWPRPFLHAFGCTQGSSVQSFLVLLWPAIDWRLLLWWSVFKLVCWVVKLSTSLPTKRQAALAKSGCVPRVVSWGSFPFPQWLAETKKAIKQHNPDKTAWLVFLSCVGLWPFTFVPGSLFSWADSRWGPRFHFML